MDSSGFNHWPLGGVGWLIAGAFTVGVAVGGMAAWLLS